MRVATLLAPSLFVLATSPGCTNEISDQGGQEDSFLGDGFANVTSLWTRSALQALPLPDGLENPFEGATASADFLSVSWTAEDGTVSDTTIAAIRLRGASPGATILSHVHVGPCANSGGHYQNVVGGATDETNEIHFDGTVNDRGNARVEAQVNFRVRSGEALSVIFHLPAQPDGTKPKAACLPLSL